MCFIQASQAFNKLGHEELLRNCSWSFEKHTQVWANCLRIRQHRPSKAKQAGSELILCSTCETLHLRVLTGWVGFCISAAKTKLALAAHNSHRENTVRTVTDRKNRSKKIKCFPVVLYYFVLLRFCILYCTFTCFSCVIQCTDRIVALAAINSSGCETCDRQQNYVLSDALDWYMSQRRARVAVNPLKHQWNCDDTSSVSRKLPPTSLLEKTTCSLTRSFVVDCLWT